MCVGSGRGGGAGGGGGGGVNAYAPVTLKNHVSMFFCKKYTVELQWLEH